MLLKDEYKGKNGYSWQVAPKLMWGIKKKIMLHFNLYASNMSGGFKFNGGGIYAKYRFFSRDEVHNHFRMAAFAGYELNNNKIQEYAINLNGRNSGYEVGLIATQLRKKMAMSASASFVHATDNINEKFLFGNKLRNAVNYTASIGRLMLPKEYISYNQTNVNLMLEFMGQLNLYSGSSWLDMAPAVQFIFNSRARVDLGYHFALAKQLPRYSTQGALLRLEYNFFNVH